MKPITITLISGTLCFIALIAWWAMEIPMLWIAAGWLGGFLLVLIVAEME